MLHVINIQNEERLSYPLCLLRIYGGPEGEKKGIVKNLSDINGNCKSYSVEYRSFNALVFLKIGKNDIEIICGYLSTKITLYYDPPEHNRSVRLLYVTCLNEDKFQGPEEIKRDANEAVKKIQIGALLMQTFLGETLNSEGLGRKSFKLEMTKQGMPKVFVIQLPLTLQEAYKFPEEKLWEKIAIQILSSPLASRSCKYLAFFCGTRFHNPEKLKVKNEREILAMTKGHVSLGGGGLALVGTGAFYAYASDVNNILESLGSSQQIDTNHLMDFSAKRGTYGACYGTHLGSVLHELGHTLDLGHTAEGIMCRGFEDFHLFFTVTQFCSNFSVQLQHKNLLRPSISSSLIKDPLTFTTDFVRKKSVDNINMIVEPLKDPLSASVVYNSALPLRNLSPSFRQHSSLNNINTVTSPCFERYETSCLSQNIKKVEFAPKSPSPMMEAEGFFKTPFMQLKTDNIKSSTSASLTDFLSHSEKTTLINENAVKCRAFWTRSNAVLLAYHKWINGNIDTEGPELKGSVLRSNHGIRAVELRDARMMAFHHWEYLGKNPPLIVHLPWAQVSHWPRDTCIEVVAIDNEGGLLKGCPIPRPL